MIRHIPEGIFPFDDCGYSRVPYQPFAGQEIALDCLCDVGSPVLEMIGLDPRSAAPNAMENSWRFTVPAFDAPCTVSYRFMCGEEATQWFTMDVLRAVNVVEPLSVGEGWAELASGVYLAGSKEAFGCKLAFGAAEPQNEECSGLEFGNGSLWKLTLDNGKILECCEMTLGLRADGSLAWQETSLAGAQTHIYGTGERFDAVDQQGKGSCGKVVEHFTNQGEWSYLPAPLFLTDGGYGFYRDTACNVSMKFGQTVRLSSSAWVGMTDHLLVGTPKKQLQGYISLTGKPALPPEWAFGLWISANGWHCDADVDEQLDMLKRNNYPASVMVLEAWSDESTFYRWNDIWQCPKDTVRRIKEAGLHLVLWQIPVLKALADAIDRGAVERDREEAVAKGYVVRHEDGSPYVIPERWFAGSLLPDFTNPEACKWWFAQRDTLLDAGVEGFKTDGGEFLFGSDVVLHDGTKGIEAHNRYPQQYVAAYQEWMRSRGIAPLTFSRAGYVGAHTTPIHWAGDQVSTWDEFQSQLNAGLSAGLSGVLFWSFDIGGFAGPLPEPELYLRATAMGCFSPVMQWHAEPRGGQFEAPDDPTVNNDRSPWNMAKFWKDPSLTETAASFARLREKLRPMLWEEAQACVREARPMMAHLCIDYPEDENALCCNDEYMLGRRWLVAPIVEKGAASRKVYLPKGLWKHFFTGEIIDGGSYEMSCPLDEILAFERMEG